MTEPLSEQVEQFETVAEEAASAVRKRERLADEIGRRLADHVETAVTDRGTTVEAVAGSAEDARFRFEARLDRAAMVASLTDDLPDGFVVSHLNDDGSLTIEWTGRDRTPTGRERDAVLKAVVAEATATDGDGLITSVPTREFVLDRAEELGLARDVAIDRLQRLETLGMIDISDGDVYPDENFSRI